MEMEEDYHITIILGRHVLAITSTITNVKQGNLTCELGYEKIEFVLSKINKNPSFKDSCLSFNITNQDIK